MKKTIILCIATILSISVSAQIKKGAVLLGFDFNVGRNTNKYQSGSNEVKNSSSGFGISLLAGKAIKDNLFFGGAASFRTNTNKQGNPAIEQTNKGYGAALWMRRYFPVAKSFYVFVNGSLDAAIGKTENKNTPSSSAKNFGLGINLYPGISYQVKKSFYLDASINNLANISYSHSKSEQKDNLGNTQTQTSNSYGISTSLGNGENPLQIGIRWIIPGKG
jgi:Outer membrane protein beta-barrel domain